MKQKFLALLSLLLCLSACTFDTNTSEQDETYANYQTALLDNGGNTSSYIPFDYAISIEEKEGSYVYTVTVDHPRVAMKKIQMLILNPDDLSTEYDSSSIGIYDEISYSMIPNQENISSGYFSSLALDGVSKSSDFTIYALVSWYDDDGLNPMVAYFSFKIVAGEAQEA